MAFKLTTKQMPEVSKEALYSRKVASDQDLLPNRKGLFEHLRTSISRMERSVASQGAKRVEGLK